MHKNSIPVSIIFTLILGLIFSHTFLYCEATTPQAFFDASNYIFDENGIFSLKGYWEYYPNSLLEPSDFANSDLEPKYITIPGELSAQQYNGEEFPSESYGTLRAVVKLKDSAALYGLKAKYLSSSNSIWINGKLLSTSGVVGTNKLEYTPKYIPSEIYFVPDSEYVEIVIQIANFHHRRIRLNEILLGKAEQIKRFTNLGIIKESIIFGSLILIAIYYGILYYFIQKREKASLYLALISLSTAIRGIIVNERVLIRLMPNISAELMSKLGYLPVFILLPLISIYIKNLFKDNENLISDYLCKYTIVFSIFLVGLTSVKVYDMVFEYAQYILIVNALYLIYILATKDVFKKSKGYKIMIICGVLLLLTAVNDLLREFDIINSFELFSFGVVIFIAIQALFLAWEFNSSYIQVQSLANENKFMFEKIQELNQDLEKKIKERTTELQMLNKKLEQTSNLDPLTGIYNRRYFENRLSHEWERAYRSSLPISVIMIDIDCFKNYNDNYGHLQGDVCLQQVATEIQLNIQRSTDLVARYGGEEFIVLLPETEASGALVLAEKIRSSIENLRIIHEYSQVSDVITVSLGVNTVIVTNEIDRKDFIDRADKGLYLAKHNGRNRVEVLASYSLYS